MLRRCALAVVWLTASAAFAGDVDVRVRVGWQFPTYRRPQRVYVPPAVRTYPVWWWVPVAPPPVAAPAPPPQVIVIEREAPPEPVPEPAPPPPPPPPPQVVVVHVAPEPAPAPPVAIVPVVPPGPVVPGPDVFSWTDDDGVVHYSTRVPADAKKRAKKIK